MVAGESLKAGYFKTHCLEMMDIVEETGQEFVITKHGRPVAKLGPVSPMQRKPLWGMFKGQIEILADIIEPTSEVWDANY
jgi:prevent-host-death family protein